MWLLSFKYVKLKLACVLLYPEHKRLVSLPLEKRKGRPPDSPDGESRHTPPAVFTFPRLPQPLQEPAKERPARADPLARQMEPGKSRRRPWYSPGGRGEEGGGRSQDALCTQTRGTRTTKKPPKKPKQKRHLLTQTGHGERDGAGSHVTYAAPLTP